MTSANTVQVGGSHYKAHGSAMLQHWDMVSLLNLDYFQGNITKYLFRWRNKNGIQDLEKPLHYLDKYIELHEDGVANLNRVTDNLTLPRIVMVFRLDYFQGTITEDVIWWRTRNGLGSLMSARENLALYIKYATEMAVPEPLSPALDQAVREAEWRGDGDSNVHPAEVVRKEAQGCILCGAASGTEHKDTCERKPKSALLYRGPDLPMLRVDAQTHAPLPAASTPTPAP